MIQEWRTFLATQGARWNDNNAVADFGNPVAERAAVPECDIIADLSHLGVIAVSGRDAATFLQGQTTCDIRTVKPGTIHIGAICNHQGRVMTTFRIFPAADGFYLTLARECVAPLLQYLNRYRLRSQVMLRDASSDSIRIGCAGAVISARLKTLFSFMSTCAEQVIHHENKTILRIGDDPPRWEIIGEYPEMMPVWNFLADQAIPIGAPSWNLFDIITGMPIITPATQALFVPHMLNLPELGAVSFNKGCYTGQEIVARTQYLGKTKRRLYRIRIDSQREILPGEILWAPGDNNPEAAVGQIVNCALSPNGSIALAVISDAALETENIRLNDANGFRVELLSNAP